MNKSNIEELKKITIRDDTAFVCCSSFEDRCKSIANTLRDKNFKKILIFANKVFHPSIIENANEIASYFEGKSLIIDVRCDDSFITSDSITYQINKLIEEGVKSLLIDITTFTHEMLAILLFVIKNKSDFFNEIKCFYMSAAEYCVGTNYNLKWLTKGCKEIRTVLGYPGEQFPRKKLTLIVLFGFEHERASAIINKIEPDNLLIGLGIAEEEHLTNPMHKQSLEYFNSLYSQLKIYNDNVNSFNFSCNNCIQTIEMIEQQIKDIDSNNYVLVPLNTKVSTLACILVALKNPRIQLCYAEAEMYNVENYSVPGNTYSFIDLKALL